MRAALPQLSVFALSAAMLAGCASYTAGISNEDKPSLSSAYLYGRFSMRAAKSIFGAYQTMGFSIKCSDEQTYLIRFTIDDPVQVIKIAPSTCALNEFVYTDADGVIKTRKPAQNELKEYLTYSPGKAYYLGDFSAASHETQGGRIVRYTWDMRSVTDNYDSTTTEMRNIFPNLAKLPSENRMLGRNVSNSEGQWPTLEK